jgi:transposase-like protein
MVGEPKTLLQAVEYFSDEETCIRYLAAKRWPNGIVRCPTCGSDRVGYLEKQKRWQCSTRHPKRQFSIKVGTIMEDSPIGLDKWLPVLWLIANCRNGISSWEIHRDLGVTQKTAWFMLHRVRLAMQDDCKGGKLSGEVEIDETFIGGKARNMHKAAKAKKLAGKRGGTVSKIGVQGILQRDGHIRAKVIKDTRYVTVVPNIQENVEKGSHVYTDELKSYFGLKGEYVHDVINHAEQYVNGQIHTNGLENFWSLLKRGLGGTYVTVEPFHLFRYVDEQAFRYNHRRHADGSKMSESDRFSNLCKQIVGRRLTYKELTGKEGQRQEDEDF